MALIEDLLPTFWATPWLLALLLTARLLYNRYGNSISGVPGPFFASLTDFWQLFDIARDGGHRSQLKLHRKHNSSLIRIGPRTVAVSDPLLVPKLYGLDPALKKSSFYDMFRTAYEGSFDTGLFTTTDEAHHTRMKTIIGGAYSMSTLVEFEPKVDSTMRVLEQRFDEFAESGQPIDITLWMSMYAFDVLGEICFSTKLGFLETSSDVHGIIADVKKNIKFGGIAIQVKALGLSMLWLISKLMPTHPIVKFCVDCIEKRQKPADGVVVQQGKGRDFLSRCYEAKAKHSDVTDDMIRTFNVENIIAGSDTTAVTLSGIFYFLMTHPRCLSRLQEEISSSAVSDSITWKVASRMPYLQACIKEGLRMFPFLGLLLERLVPKGGLDLNGVYLPEGTIVGCNPSVISRREEVYGPDANSFVPERWLDADSAKVKAMERASLSWGGGKHTCIGKNIAMLEMSKIIPQLLRRYEFKFPRHKDETRTIGVWFVRLENFDIVVKKRRAAAY